jgi:hypothetical protein
LNLRAKDWLRPLTDDVLSEERDETGDFAPRILNWAGAYTILFVGLAHLLVVGEHFLAATYLGVLFLANCAGAVVAAAGLYLGRYTWAWLLGDLVAGGAFVGFLVSRAIGIPEAPQFVGQWFNIAGLLTLALEGLFLSLSFLAVTPWGTALMRREQRRIERERAAPARQETPERLEDIEKEMSEIRSRTASDLSDLRKHAEPRVVKERIEQALRKRLRGIPGLPKRVPERSGIPRPEDWIRAAREAARRDPRPLVSLAALAAVAVFIARRASGKNG